MAGKTVPAPTFGLVYDRGRRARSSIYADRRERRQLLRRRPSRARISSAIPWSPSTRIRESTNGIFNSSITISGIKSICLLRLFLVDIVKDGKRIPALAAMGKSGWMLPYSIALPANPCSASRSTRFFGDVPGEWYSLTQPFPLKPPALARTGLRREDVVSAEEHDAGTRKGVSGAVGQESVLQRRTFHAVAIPRGGGPASRDDLVPGASGVASSGRQQPIRDQATYSFNPKKTR